MSFSILSKAQVLIIRWQLSTLTHKQQWNTMRGCSLNILKDKRDRTHGVTHSTTIASMRFIEVFSAIRIEAFMIPWKKLTQTFSTATVYCRSELKFWNIYQFHRRLHSVESSLSQNVKPVGKRHADLRVSIARNIYYTVHFVNFRFEEPQMLVWVVVTEVILWVI